MEHTDVSLLGLGEMGRALAGSLLASGRTVTTWNRTSGREHELVDRGALHRPDVGAAIGASPVVVACLYDHASVLATLEPVADALKGRALVNLTTTSPQQARELSAWAAEHGVAYLDGAIMAVPAMIGSPGASILYSGSAEVFETQRPMLETWATTTYDGPDAGTASLYDLAMLSGMYTMIVGFLHGAAMVAPAGISAADYARRATPFLAAMTGSFASSASVLDDRDFADPVQSLGWTREVLGTIAQAAQEQAVDPAVMDLLLGLADRQIDAGHAADAFYRVVDSLRPAA